MKRKCKEKEQEEEKNVFFIIFPLNIEEMKKKYKKLNVIFHIF